MPPKTASTRTKSVTTTPTAPTLAAAPASAAAPAAMVASSVPQGGTQEVTSHVQGLMQQMQARFEEMSKCIVTRIDEMNSRIDELEQSIDNLMQQSGGDQAEKPAARSKK